MALLNFGRTTVNVAPSPATSGLAFTVASSTGALRIGTGPAVLCPADVYPTPENAEIVEVSAVSGDTITLSARAQEGTTARSVASGWQVLQGITAAMWAAAEPDDLVAALHARSEFTIAHRGGDEAYGPEHTEAAYLGALAAGCDAVEVSNRLLADGVNVCHHDDTWTRTTLLSGNVVETYSAKALGGAPIVDYGASFLGSAWVNQRLPRTSDVLDLLAERCVVYLEPKASNNASTAALLELVTRHRAPGRWCVWKYAAEADGLHPTHAANAAAAGLRTWAYLDSAASNAVIDASIAGDADYLGVPLEMSDAQISRVVAGGKPVIAFDVRRRVERDRVQGLGVEGLMCSAPPYVDTDVAARLTDAFDNGAAVPGHLYTSDNWRGTYDGTNGNLALGASPNAAVVLGDMCPIAELDGSYTIEFELLWDDLPSPTSLHADLFFGHDTDVAYTHQGLTNDDGYHLVVRASGVVDLFRHSTGSSSGTQLITSTTTAFAADTWYPFKITVTPTNVGFQRVDTAQALQTIANTHARGGYFGLTSATSSTATLWRNVTVTNL